MEKNVSIVKVDTRHYRTIARENWGLTREQMKRKHVHHRIKRSEGGTNDPTNLYVCSEWFHDNIWHSSDNGFAGVASVGAKKAHQEKDTDGKSLLGKKNAERLHSKRDQNGKSLIGLNLNAKLHAKKDEDGKSIQGKRAGERLHADRDENGKCIRSMKNAQTMNSQRWMCTVTGYVSNPGHLTRIQKAQGIDPSNRVRVK